MTTAPTAPGRCPLCGGANRCAMEALCATCVARFNDGAPA